MRQLRGLPELLITLAGRRLSPRESAAVLRVDVRLVLAQPAQCVISWLIDDTPPARRVNPSAGDSLRVEIGGLRVPLFVGEVTVVEYSYGANSAREVSVRAYDALHRLRKRQATRLHDDVDLASLTRTLTAGTGLAVRAEPIRLGRVYQCARTDLDLLVHTSRRVGRFPVVDDGVLHLVSLDGDGDGDGEPIVLELGSNLHSATIEISQEPAYRSATTARWDPGTATGSSRTASSGRGRAGVRADPAPESVGGGGVLLRNDEVLGDDELATALAQAELDVRVAAEVSASLVADGDPSLRPGRRVRLLGVQESVEGTYTVSEAVHTLTGSGYETTVSTRPPAGPGGRPRDQVTLGVVDRVDDPESRGRAVLRLPAYPELRTGWAPVLVSAAGPGKGVVALPDVGDTVLVLLPAGDPDQAIVLGGLYGAGRTPDAGTDSPRGGRYSVRTADGQEVTVDGHLHTVVLADGHGSQVELGPDLLRIHAATDLVIQAPGRSILVRARTVDFEEVP